VSPLRAKTLRKNKADILHLSNHYDLGKLRFVEEKISGKISWRERKIAELLVFCPLKA
jgi:hypothetical protein